MPKIPPPPAPPGTASPDLRPMGPYPAVWTKKGCGKPQTIVVTLMAMSTDGRKFLVAANDAPPQLVGRSELTVNSLYTPVPEGQPASGKVLTLEQIEAEMRGRRG